MSLTSAVLKDNGLHFSGCSGSQALTWQGALNTVAFDKEGIQAKLRNLDQPCYVLRLNEQIGIANDGDLVDAEKGKTNQPGILAAVPPLSAQQMGDSSFLKFHGVKYAYAAGAMANGIASEEMVIALGRAGILSSFGAAGLILTRIEAAIERIQKALPFGPYAFNLIHSPSEAAIERGAVDLYLKYGVTTVEASAFLNLTPTIVYYRTAGLSLDALGRIELKNRVIAKVSRLEIAAKFMQPAPAKILKQLVEQNLITELQATLAEKVPLADDITVEADSGGHTDNRSLVCLLPCILSLRDEMHEKYGYESLIRVGAAGGIGTPQSALAAFMMGAAYVVTGSINQSCIEAGASAYTKNLLAQASMNDVAMAPAADMFEMGVKLQVLKRGTLFPMRAQKLFDIYQNYGSIDEITAEQREYIEAEIFRKSLEQVWQDTQAYFAERDPDQIVRAVSNPKRKMALIFRSYLGLSSRWSNTGEESREEDYQIWCGPAMGAFNNWVEGSHLEKPINRHVSDVAYHIMTGATFLYRLHHLKMQELHLPAGYWSYRLC